MDEILKKYFQDELSKHSFFSASLVATYKSSHWIDVATDEPVGDQETIERLNGRNASLKFKRYSSPWKVVFWAPKTNIAIMVDVPKKTRETTLNNQYDVFIRCINTATKSYYANHDPLTGVLNRHGLQWAFDRVILSVPYSESDESELESQLLNANEVTLFSFDIDKFKNINDTYGHDVGDAVLSIFASRISGILPELEKKHSISCTFGRPGGEEFELIVKGQADLVVAKRVADDLIQCVRQPKLPSSDEIKKFLKRIPNFPAARELQSLDGSVTASIGISTKVIGKTATDNEKLYTSLRREADLGLYRAKSDGRNCYRLFSDIRTSHGRVHKSHNDSQLVVIDIGLDVGVEIGDIYRVFFPPFLKQDIRFEDGRTSRVLGKYPLIESARLIVIDAQEKVATCSVIDNSTGSDIPDGALLQYVHTGSVPFLHERPRQLAYNIFPLEGLLDYIERLKATDSLYSIVRISGSFKKTEGRERDAIVSQIAAAMHLIFPRGTRLFGGNGCGLYIISRVNEDGSQDVGEREKVIRLALLKLSPWLDGIRAGVYIPGAVGEQVDTCAEAMVFYCNSALTATRTNNLDNPIIVFSEDSIGDTIYTWRQRRMIEDALVDYQQFKSYGFDLPKLNNQLGLAVLEARVADYYQLGLLAFSNAVQSDESYVIYRANLALLNTISGNYEAARELFEDKGVVTYLNRSSTNSSYLLANAKCLIESIKSGKHSIGKETTEMLAGLATKVESPQPFVTYEDWRRDLVAFLDTA